MAIFIIIADLVPERGTVKATVNFLDETGAAVVPVTASWSLTDASGTVVNGRDGVAIGSLASSVVIVMSGLDLAVGSGLVGTVRKLLIEATYNSTIGNNLPLKAEVTFQIANFVKPTGIT